VLKNRGDRLDNNFDLESRPAVDMPLGSLGGPLEGARYRACRGVLCGGGDFCRPHRISISAFRLVGREGLKSSARG